MAGIPLIYEEKLVLGVLRELLFAKSTRNPSKSLCAKPALFSKIGETEFFNSLFTFDIAPPVLLPSQPEESTVFM